MREKILYVIAMTLIVSQVMTPFMALASTTGGLEFNIVEGDPMIGDVDAQEDIPSSFVLDEVVGLAGNLFTTEGSPEVHILEAKPENLKNFFLVQTSVIMERNGFTENIDVIGQGESGRYYNLTTVADWRTTDDSIAIAYRGWILATGKGATMIEVTYGDFSTAVSVEVLDEIDLQAEIDRLNFSKNSRGFTSSERNSINTRAVKMMQVKWSAKQTFIGWATRKTFEAGTTYTGIPYTQQTQLNEVGFMNAYNNYANFYENVTAKSAGSGEMTIQPRYGSDCSGFISFAWGIPRETTTDMRNKIKDGSYNKVGLYNPDNLNAASLQEAYKFLMPGDALVTAGHVRLVASVDYGNKIVYCYEQTPPETKSTSYTFSKLASENYMPFTKQTEVEWRSANGIYYCFVNGALVKGWKQVNNIWYYLEATSGAMQAGWRQINNVWYYFNPTSGAMVVGSHKIKNINYYFRGDGAMHTQWLQLGSNWYYFGNDGVRVQNDWYLEKGVWYWFKSTGIMAKSEIFVIKSKKYSFDSTGRCTNP